MTTEQSKLHGGPMTCPNCYDCAHRHDTKDRSSCDNLSAKVRGNSHGISHGWFAWPHSFVPAWLDACDGFEARAEVERIGELIDNALNEERDKLMRGE
jgi:hypothetical protein